MNITSLVNCPAELDTRRAQVVDRLSSIDWPHAGGDLKTSALHVCIVSDFVLTQLVREPELLLARVADSSPLTVEAVKQRLVLAALSEADAMAHLRRLRNLELARIAWRDIAGTDDLATCLCNLSVLADALIEVALEFAAGQLAPRYGYPRDASGRDAPLLVLAMGKLGGRELNFSSDIDLVFLYPDEVAVDGPKSCEAEEYYRRISQALIKLLDQRTADGIVFRVDTRLRPFGSSGPLAVSVSAFEAYLVSNGRDWERYAYQKARLITGVEFSSEVFDEILVPFVYRRYLDFGIFAALRMMKSLIRKEVARQEMADNVKLGPGGIREIEFIVQVLQLLRGGQTPSLRSNSLQQVLPMLAGKKELGAESVRRLVEAYEFLRTLENRLQEMGDRQTHTLPTDRIERAQLAFAMGDPDWDTLYGRLTKQRTAVEDEFDRVARESQGDESVDPQREAISLAWESGRVDDALTGTKLEGDQEAVERLQSLRAGSLYERMDEVSRLRLAAVMTRTIALLDEHVDPAAVLARIIPVYQAICRRSAYLALLDENPAALQSLLVLAGRSGMVTRQIAQHPVLLDELLDPRVFETPPTRKEFRDLLAQQLTATSGDDVESSLDAMRAFHSAAIFRIAVADTLGQLPLMHVSDRLTDTAELIVRFALKLARSELEGRFGRPMCGSDGDRRQAEFAVVAYGKLAGLELGYGSDLDLVFVHDSSGERQETDGRKAMDNTIYFARLAQRLIHFLSIQTTAGRLYEVDTRLRPGGESGILVASIENFRRYQASEAWVWEHQALLRSRAIAGGADLCTRFESVRKEILMQHIDREQLQQKIVEMRIRMRSELSKAGEPEFDLKQDEGGLADIEFLVDYLVLAHSRDHAELVEFPDNVRQLEALEQTGLIESERAGDLKACYLALRRRAHELALDDAGRVVAKTQFDDVRHTVGAIWKDVFG